VSTVSIPITVAIKGTSVELTIAGKLAHAWTVEHQDGRPTIRDREDFTPREPEPHPAMAPCNKCGTMGSAGTFHRACFGGIHGYETKTSGTPTTR
jgi:hypothetical protein